ncbi:RimK family protein [Thalassobaculum sp.]|uniref:RimK family protein n=1 Tax=Thalassobaculum sp. TaxID=2022740 RepID=UPI0032EC87BC
MSTLVVLVDRPEDLPIPPEGLQVMRTRDYLTNPNTFGDATPRIVNLSRDLVYLGQGYYASLLAEARGHRVIPSAAAILSLKERGRSWTGMRAVERVLLRSLARIKEVPEASFSIDAYFGRTADPRYERVAREAFDRFRAPILRIQIRRDPEWGFYVKAIRPRTIDELHAAEQPVFAAALEAYTRRTWRAPKGPKRVRYTLAVLHDPKEALPPSDPKALATLERVGAQMGVSVELIQPKDYSRLAEFDALFIRMTTALDNPTYRFARKAEDEGMPVLDDPTSILRCTNKVFLAETLIARKIPAPKTLVLDSRSLKRATDELSFPIVLKIPDGSFSRGVMKADNLDTLKRMSKELFSDSDLILAQEFMPTEFDWRVGVLDGKPLFVSQYTMAPKHWQIYNHGASGNAKHGGFRTLAVEDTPKQVLDVATAAARLMGLGLYGVDLKQNDRGVFVVEVNDNPNIDSGVEDKVLKDGLYRTLLESFIRRIDAG